MKNLVKRNQIVLFTVALMLIVAGYMNYTVNTQDVLKTAAITDTEKYADIGDARLVSSESIETEENIDCNTESEAIVANEEDKVNNSTENSIEQTKQVSNTVKQYFTQSRIDRDNMYSQMIESYDKILNNEKMSEEQRNIAENEITNVNNRKNATMIAENLIKNKGIEDVIIFVNDKSINVVVRADELKQEQVAQIQNIIQREFGAETTDIHISNK